MRLKIKPKKLLKKEFLIKFLTVIISALSLTIVSFLRIKNSAYLPPGPESYNSLLLAKDLALGSQTINLFHLVLRIMNNNFVILAFQILLGMLSLIFLSKFFAELKLKPEVRIAAILIFLLSPLFLYSHSAFISYPLLCFLSIASAYCLIKKRLALLSAALVAASLIDVYVFAFLLLAGVIYSLKSRLLRDYLKMIVLPGLIALIFSIFIFRFNIFPVIENPGLSSIFADFGSLAGYSLFIALMAFIEIIS
ncbi:MAG: hypothetical protein V1659_01785, partial [Candidatus Woesearchaeota archaeon]